ncbi:hypothetical protein CAPTEDRAFT_200401 [Capitella teleta]|uniref:Uncharacterized protein n=1 Tax=Capitella teleta TaxID=283909 RepID=R7UVS2_CAPTE|nr:hypothetical protein CAPTEDRAFT_200401 [Capitella teleta]|eukprot:ELU10362.1 hypothetical protein CAPTEDRAFT_200401 [Capitella teleta]
MKRFAADTEDWVLHEVSPVARADDYVKEQHKASLLEDSKIVDTETEDDSKRHGYAASKFACESDEDAQRAGEKLQRYVVDDLAKSVQATLGVVMTNTLALTITWTGNSHGATIYNRVKKNHALIATRFKKAALCDVRNATQNWLSNSPDRIDPTTGTGGKERMERTRKRKEQMFSEDAIEHDSSNSVLE